jgi:hypothetical protein
MLVQPAVENKLIWLGWLLITGIFMVATTWTAASGISQFLKFYGFSR